MKRIIASTLTLAGLLLAATCPAANITMNTNDAVGASSFNGGANWPGSVAPVSGNAYFTTNFILRTPTAAGGYSFAGDSLSVDAGGSMYLITPGNTSTVLSSPVTVNNLILNGGTIRNASGVQYLIGNITNAAAVSKIDVQGISRAIYLQAPISGAGVINEVVGTGGDTTNGTVYLYSDSPLFTGQWVIADASNSIAGSKPVLNLASANALQNATLSLNTVNNNSLQISYGVTPNPTLGGLTGTGNVALQENFSFTPITLQVGNNNASTVYSGVLSSGGSLIKIGTGSLTLSNTNTYSGSTLINGGTLLGVVGGGCASSDVSVAATSGNTATLGVSITDNTKQWACTSLTVDNSLSGGTASNLKFDFGAVIPSTSLAPLSVAGNVTLTTLPTITIAGGNLPLSTGNGYPLMTWGGSGPANAAGIGLVVPQRPFSGPMIVANLAVVGNTLYLQVTATTQPLRWTGGNGTWDVNNSANNTIWKDNTGANTYYEQGAASDAVFFGNVVGSGGTVTLNTNVSPGSVTVSNTTLYTISGSGTIAGGTSLIKSGSGPLTLATTNTYTGGTVINGGTLTMGVAGAIASGTPLTVNGGALDKNGLALTVSSIAGTGGTITNGTTLTVSPGAGTTFAGDITGAGSLTKAGTGSQLLSGNDTYSGATTINGGVLSGVVGGSISNSAVTVAATTNNTAALGVSITDNTKQWTVPSVTITNAGASSGLRFDFGAVTPSTTVAPLNITGSVAFTTPPTITVSGTSLLQTTGNGYPLMTWGAGSAPSLAGVIASGSGDIALSIVGNTLYMQTSGRANPLSWTGGDGTWDVNNSGNLIWQDQFGAPAYYQEDQFHDSVIFGGVVGFGGTVTLNTTVSPGSVTVTNAAYTISGSGSIAGSTSLIKSGTGMLTLATSNTFSGGLNYAGNTLTVAAAGALGSGPVVSTGAGTLTFNTPTDATFTNKMTLNAPNNGAALLNQGPSTITLNGNMAVTGSGSFEIISGVNQGGFVLGGSNTFSLRLTIQNTAVTLANSFAVASVSQNRITLGDFPTTASALYLANGVTNRFPVNSSGNNAFTGSAIFTVGMQVPGTSIFVGANPLMNLRQPSDTGTISWNFEAGSGATCIFGGAIGNTHLTVFAPITKIGAGTVVFSGTNTYRGTTTVANGLLQGVVGGSSIGSDVTVAATSGNTAALGVSIPNNTKRWTCASLTVNNSLNGGASSDLQFDFGAVTPSASVAPLNVTNTVVFTTAPVITILGSSLPLSTGNGYQLLSWGAGSAPNTNGVTLTLPVGYAGNLAIAGNILYLQITGTPAPKLYWAGGNGTWDDNISGNLIWKNESLALTYFTNGTAAIFNNTVGSGGTVAMNTAVSPTSITVTNPTADYTISGSGGIAGTTGLSKSGAGALTLATTNTFTGGTAVSGGTLTLAVPGALTNGASVTVSGGTLRLGVAGAIAGNTASVTVNGGLFDKNGQTLTVASLAGTGGTISNSTWLTVNQSAVSTYGGVIAGSGSLTNAGAGSLSLSGNNTYSGVTVIKNGTLAGVVGGSCSNSAVTVAATAGNTAALGVSVTDITKQWTCPSLTVNNAGTKSGLQFSFGALTPSTTVAPLKITGSVAFTTPPTITITGSSLPVPTGNGYPLMTWGAGSAPSLTGVSVSPVSVGGGLVIVGNTLYLQISSRANPLSWTGGAGTWDINNVANPIWKDNNGVLTNYQEDAFHDAVNFDNVSGTGGTVTLDTNVSPAGITVNNAAYTISGSGSIGGLNTALTKTGTGMLTLATTNTFGGGLTFANSTLTVASAGALGSGPVANTGSSTLFFNTPTDATFSNAITMTVVNNAAIQNNSPTSTITLNGNLALSGANNSTFIGQGDVNAGGFVLGGSNVLNTTRFIVMNTSVTLANNNAANSPNFQRIALGESGGGASAVYLANGITYAFRVLDANNADANNIVYYVGMKAAGTSTYSGNPSVDLHFRATGGTGCSWNFVADTNATVTFAGPIANTGGGVQPVTKIGAGTVVFGGTNTYTGTTTVANGLLQGVTGGSSSSSAVTVAATAGNAAALGVSITDNTMQWTCASLTVDNNLSGGASSGLQFSFGQLPSTTVAPLNVTGSVLFNTAPAISVSGGGLLVTTGNGYPLLAWGGTGPSTTNGITLTLPANIGGNLAILGNTLYLQITSSYLPLHWAGGNGTWDTNNSGNLIWKDNNSVNAYYVDPNTVIFDNTIGSGGTVTLNTMVSPVGFTVNNPTTDYTISGNGGIAGTTRLIKSGAGKLTLNTTNTYTGITVVSNGTLLVNGSLAAGSAVTVATGATLGGTGTIRGAVTYSPGSSALFTNGSPLTFSGVLNGDSTAVVHLLLSNNVPVGTNLIATYVGGANNFAATPVIDSGSLAAGAVASITRAGGQINLVVQINLTPTATNITYSVSGNQLVLSWPDGQGWRLQAQTNTTPATGLTTNWIEVIGATPPFTNIVNPDDSSVFYRLIYP